MYNWGKRKTKEWDRSGKSRKSRESRKKFYESNFISAYSCDTGCVVAVGAPCEIANRTFIYS